MQPHALETTVVNRPLIPSGRQVELVRDAQRATVVEVGGGLRDYRVFGAAVLDGYGPEEMCHAGRGQILIPWPNRLADGSYDLDGEHHHLPLTEPGAHNAIHGLVRFSSWTVAEQGPSHVVMAHRLHPQPGYPFMVDLRVEYSLDDGGLAVHSRATNRGDRPCPYGAGAHPYLRVGAEGIDRLLLRSPGAVWYANDDRGIAANRRSADGTGYDFRRPRPIGGTRLDTAFTELEREDDGRAVVDLREPEGTRGVALWLDGGYPYLMLFSGDSLPEESCRRQSLAVEPMTCAPNAFRTGDGLMVLEPGEFTEASWGIATTGFGPS